MSKLWNLVTKFGITMRNALKEVSTNKPGIGSLIREIHVKITEMLGSKTDFRSVKPIPAY